MPGLGPGDGPGRRSPKPKRKPKPRSRPQQSTEARKGAAFGSRPARPERRPGHTYRPPAPKPPQGDTKSDRDLGRAKSYERTPKYREAVRDTYKEQPRQQRRDILNNDAPGAAGAEAQRFHDERVRVQQYVNKAREFASNPDAEVSSHDEADQIRKGLEVLKHQREAALGKLAAIEHAQPRYGTGEASSGKKSHNLLEGVTSAIKAAAGVDTGTAKDKGAVAANETFLGNVKRVEKSSGPVDFAYRSALKPTIDSTAKILEQTNRLASASAGATEAALEGKNVAKGAVEGAIHNDKSYVDLVKKTGLKGAPAVILGTAGDILLDPSTYASFGLTAPAKAAERAAARKIARKIAPQVKKAAKAGDEELQAKLAAQYEDELAVARRRIAAKGLEDQTRGVQAGVRLPGGRELRTRGRATAAAGKQATRVTGRVQAAKATKPINEVLRAFAPHVREPGVRPAEQATRQAIQRESNALRNRVAREGRQLGKFIQRATGGDIERVRQIVDAIEHGTVDQLEGPLRVAAERAVKFHDEVAARFKELTGRDLKLVETILPSKDVDEALGLARQVLDARVSKAGADLERADHAAEVTTAEGNAARTADANAKVTDRAVDLAGAESLAERIGSKEHPLHISEERELVDRLAGVVDSLRADTHANMARGRMNDELGAIRRGDVENADVRKALEAEDFYKRRAADQRAAGNRTAARASEAKARQARAVIKAHRAEVEPQHLEAVRSEGDNVLKGRAGKLEQVLGKLQERVQYEPPAGYSPRQTQAAMDAAAEGKPLRQTVYPDGATGHEAERLERRRASDVRAEKPDYLSDELPQLEARYGIKMGRRLGSLALWKRVMQSEARPVTGEFPIEGDQVLYRVDGKGQHGFTRIDPNDTQAVQQALAEAALRHGMGEDPGIYAVADQADEMLQSRIGKSEQKPDVLHLYDKWLRGFKAANTILRPGFFATTVAGNMWQQYLADASLADMKRAWQYLAHMRSADLKAIDPKAGVGFRGEPGGRAALLDKIAGDKTYVVDGRAVKFSDLFDEAIDAGAVRTGSRIGDPTELTLEEHAHRRIGKGAKAKAGAANEWLGEVAEDLDDMTKAMLYVRGRTKLGMSPRDATQYAFTKMIDYSDLSPAERKVFKRVMPFYVYTARNLPIQVKSILARPGKLANFEKVRQALAELAGLPPDWEGQRSEAEQERMPVAIPGVKSHGFQVFLDPRLPVADLAAPAQLEEGPGGAVRMLERYGSGVAPPVKVPLELLLFKRRLDYDRPIDVPGSPPAAGALLKLIGATKKGTYIQPATGEKYTGAIPAVDYLLRTLGGSPGSVIASVGADVPDRSNLDPKARAAASFGGGFGVSASDPLYNPLYDTLRKLTEKRYAKRAELKGRGMRDSAEDIRNEDAIDALNNVKAKIQAAIGFPEQKKNLFGLEKQRLEIDTREPAEMRAERRRLDALRKQYGG